jgi:hypothetical protein
VSPRDHDLDTADQQRTGEDHPAGAGEPEPATEPAPVASDSGHASIPARLNAALAAPDDLDAIPVW